MYLPKLNKHTTKSIVINSFKGINKGVVGEENEFYDTENLTSKAFPALTSAPESYELECINTGSVIDPIFFLNGKVGCITSFREDAPDICKFIYGGEAITNFYFPQGATQANKVNFNGKTLLAKGATAYEFDPDYKTFTTALSRVGYEIDISPTYETSEYNKPTLSLSFVYEDMTEIGKVYQETTDFPSEAEVNDLCIKKLECYRLIFKGTEASQNIWQPVVSLRLRLEIGDGYRNFKVGDYIRLSKFKYWNWAVRELEALNRFVRIDGVDGEGRFVTASLTLFEDYNMILNKMEYPTNDIPGYNRPIINNSGNSLPLLSGNVSACMPELDMLCLGANRVWGCNSKRGEIYASELGSARNWSVFEGLSSDSYCLTVGSPGDFTACCNFRGSPIFFKEKEIIVISGSRPSSFALNSYNVCGVSRYSPNGLCVTENAVYYLGYDGVYLYNGSSSACISGKIGDSLRRLQKGVLACHGGMLYVCGEKEGKEVSYVYDTKQDVWHRCSGERVIAFLGYPDALLKVIQKGEESLITTVTDAIPLEYELKGAALKKKSWMWESVDISYGTTDKKYVRRISLDMLCDEASQLYISYDGGTFVHIGHFPPHPRGSRRVYIYPKRCSVFRLRMEGEGRMTLHNITKDVEEASENG